MSDDFLPPVKADGALMDACPNLTKWSILFGPTDLSLLSMCFLEEITSDTSDTSAIDKTDKIAIDLFEKRVVRRLLSMKEEREASRK